MLLSNLELKKCWNAEMFQQINSKCYDKFEIPFKFFKRFKNKSYM